MAKARLRALTIERFKSYRDETRIEFDPLTILVGRNNCGKSSIIQALLLLKQTLAHPRSDIPLVLEGYVDALSLRELIYGWPESDHNGFRFILEWSSHISIDDFLAEAKNPDIENFITTIGIRWVKVVERTRAVRTKLDITFNERRGTTIISRIRLASIDRKGRDSHTFVLDSDGDGGYSVMYKDQLASKLDVEWDHFLPYLTIDRRNIGPRHKQRAIYNLFLLLFSQPLTDLKRLLAAFSYLGSMRTAPPTLYRSATVPPEEIGVSGELAAQLLQARKAGIVNYLPLLDVTESGVTFPKTIRSRSLLEAMNDMLESLGVEHSLRIEDVKDIGFRLLFGQASLPHVGRGLSYLVPVIELGLISDPLKFAREQGEIPLKDYLSIVDQTILCAFEEPEAHLHPKVQSRLAHWFVSLALAGRNPLVETHSDHFVRRLRGLVARTKPDSPLEKYLLKNVVILSIEQNADGSSSVKSTKLTREGSLDTWPADFMDEATDEERSIHFAGLDKPKDDSQYAPPEYFTHDPIPDSD